MDIPFKFKIQEKVKRSEENPLGYEMIDYSSYFFKESTNVPDQKMIPITENIDIIIEINSPQNDARIYMDTLDYYQSSICQEDDNGNIYIEESQEPIVLFKNLSIPNSNLSYYPFIPGTYQIYVTCGKEKYYAYINVSPKQVTNNELNIMREELEEMIENLAHMLVNNESAAKVETTSDNRESITNQLLILSNNCNKIIPIVNEIKLSPRSKVINQYQLEDTYQARIIDHETIKYRLKRTDAQTKLLVPKRLVSRNLPENLVIIDVVKYLHKVTRSAIQYTEQILPHIEYDTNRLSGGKYPRPESEKVKYLKQIESLKESRKKMKKLSNTFNYFLQSEWVKEVKGKSSNATGLHLDGRYRFLYQIYRELKIMKKKIQLNTDFSYRWKRTDKLYEMWCFVKLLKALQSPILGFKPISGWIYGDKEILDTWKVPLLKEGTTITLQGKENKVINLVYDKSITYDRKLTRYEDPLYSQFPNNRPDTRIDFYDDDKYGASYIIDFKYRPAEAIGNLRVSEYNNEWTAYKQLLHYSKFDSEFVNKTKEHTITDKKFRSTSPIAGVWVFFPNAETNKSNREITKKDWLTKIPFSPGENSEKLENLILEALKHEMFI
ncbi:nuclease domain-containing protein [Bacillus sp. Cr_A10]|uniref:nuclease domain-containing protein n=1 Tax=Bacillus sp. Cr_A10 TaxID=3033993 RepID=UPI0023DB34A7|nr:nuclease domain-containing protein [Bacillus sp. Cr_A10]MDF2064963.1 nuclease domain-containing protein [Bacillus sp. Cr_A10]